jgi:hypothetical protein
MNNNNNNTDWISLKNDEGDNQMRNLISAAFSTNKKRDNPDQEVDDMIRPVTNVKILKTKFTQDPIGTLSKNLPPYIDKDSFDLWAMDGKVEEAVDWFKHNEETKNELWKNKIYRFLKLVEGYIHEPGTAHIPAMYRKLSKRPLQKTETIQTATAQSTVPATVLGNNETVEESVEDLQTQYLHDVMEVMDTEHVMGNFAFSNPVFQAVNNAITELTKHNFEKFHTATMKFFFEHEKVMILFSQLTGELFLLLNVKSKDRYFHNSDESRRWATIKNKVKEIDSMTKLDKSRIFFTIVTPKEYEIGKKQKLEQFQTAFDSFL